VFLLLRVRVRLRRRIERVDVEQAGAYTIQT
jgi:hypothetical protein